MHRRDAVRPDGGAEETGIEGKADGLTGLGRDGPLLDRRCEVRGEAWHYPTGAGCTYGMTVEYALTVGTRCASSRNGCLPAARNTSGGVYPGRGVEE